MASKALNNAISERKTAQPQAYQSDRDTQYCSDLHQKRHYLLNDKRLRRLSECDGRAGKRDFEDEAPTDLAQARAMVNEMVGIYNKERPHLALKYKTSEAVHRAF